MKKKKHLYDLVALLLAFRTNERINKWTSFDINIHIGKRMLWFKFKSNANCSAPFIQPFIRSLVHSLVQSLFHSLIHSLVSLCAIPYCISFPFFLSLLWMWVQINVYTKSFFLELNWKESLLFTIYLWYWSCYFCHRFFLHHILFF